MSDGISDSRREEHVWNALNDALYKLDEVLEDIYDPLFGLPIGAIEELEIVLKKYNLNIKKAK